MNVQEYFNQLDNLVSESYKIAKKAREKKYDPYNDVEIISVKNMAEKVEGLVSVVSPNIKNKGIPSRIIELEKRYGKLDWRVALGISLEVAQEEFCKFNTKIEAIETGIRVGFAYITLGSVASPLEGFVKLVLKKRKDGKEYFCLYYSGPVRSAGGTGASVSVLIADYIRKKFGYDKYDPTEKEIKRAYTELLDYHERVTNLQYLPSEQEVEFLVKNLPVQIDGDPSEKYEVSNYKDLDRIETNRLRNGFCLVIAECLAQKAQKILAQLRKLRKDFDMGDWDFLSDFVDIQKRLKSKEKEKQESLKHKLRPDYTFIKDIVAGRPVLTYPSSKGGFRLRYGRCRNSGLSSMAIHPATMVVLKNFIAIGTQLKVERPGKSTALSSCDTIEGPIVKLDDGEVLILDDVSFAIKVVNRVEEILFLGDLLVSYGDFLNRAHVLVPPGYCEEWWASELKESITNKEFKLDNLDKNLITDIINKPNHIKINFDRAYEISKKFNIPLHPRFTLHWNDIYIDELSTLFREIKNFEVQKDKNYRVLVPLKSEIKHILEKIGLPHKQIIEKILIEDDWSKSFLCSLGLLNNDFDENRFSVNFNEEDSLSVINSISEIKLRDKSGSSIGARMGRPEKAKIRKLTGSPHVLFPVGEEGGRLRAVQSAIESNTVYAEFPIYMCKGCNQESVYMICHRCGKETAKLYYCEKCDKYFGTDKCSVHGNLNSYSKRSIDIVSYLEAAKNKLKLKDILGLIKGIRGTSNQEHITENLVKGILRATYNLTVNKDGTIRYDMIEIALTHFRPIDIGTPIERLKELGYDTDIYGKPLKDEYQILELKVQDVVLPTCAESLEEGADVVLFRVSKFVDDLLSNFYGLDKFYNLNSKENLIGHLILGLAPHTSAAILGRIIGFSKTQGCYAHPMWHCAIRRDCFGYNTNIPLFYKGCWENVEIGDFVEKLNPTQRVDSFGTLARDVKDTFTLAYNTNTNKIDIMPVKWFTKHTKSKLIKLYLENGREIKTTINHKFYVKSNNLQIKTASEIIEGDKLIVPYNFDIYETNLNFLDLERIYSNRKDLMVRGIKEFIKEKIRLTNIKNFCKVFSIEKKNIYNYINRDSFPIILIDKILKYYSYDYEDLQKKRRISIKRDRINFPYKIPINEDFLEIIGFYISEGWARNKEKGKGFYQIGFAIYEDELRERMKSKIYKIFNLKPTKNEGKLLLYSSRLFYELFIKILKCGKKAPHKRIPRIFINLPKNKIKNLLRAYFEGDGSASKSQLRVTCDTVSEGLIYDLEFVLARFGIYLKKYRSKREPGRTLKKFYVQKNRKIPKFESTKLTIPSKFVKIYFTEINFISKRKRNILNYIVTNISPRLYKLEHDEFNAYLKVIKKEILDDEITYCLNVPSHHNVIVNGIVSKQCDGDECAVMLLMDGLLNFSRKFLPMHRGSTQDAPLVMTTKLIPSEVDDMVFDMDISWGYPLEFYEACLQYKMPSEVSVDIVKHRLGTDKQYHGFGFTHDTSNINSGVKCSAYKSLPTMMEKVRGQMELAEMIRAVDTDDVARLVIERHFIRDIRGNLRKFSMQQFRCSKCNEKYRRPPLIGKCIKCDGKLILTISEGSIIKYLKPSLELANKYKLSPYLKQSLELTKNRIESIFGKERELQSGLQTWF